MKIIKEGKLKEASKVSYEDLFAAYPEEILGLEDLQEGFNRIYNTASVRVFSDLSNQISMNLNFAAACLLTGDDKYKTSLQKFNKEIQEEADYIAQAAKEANKAVTSAIKLLDKLSKI